MHRDVAVDTHCRKAFLAAAKIERAADAEFAQHRDVAGGQVAEMIGAEDLAPTHRAAILCGIAADVTEIAGAGEIEVTSVLRHAVIVTCRKLRTNDKDAAVG